MIYNAHALQEGEGIEMNFIQKISKVDRKLIVAGVICTLICFVGFGCFVACKVLEAIGQQQLEALAPIAERVGIEPTSIALRNYVEKTFTPGMSRDEVTKELDKMGTYYLRQYPMELEGKGWLEEATFEIDFYGSLTIGFRYANDGTLVRASMYELGY